MVCEVKGRREGKETEEDEREKGWEGKERKGDEGEREGLGCSGGIQ